MNEKLLLISCDQKLSDLSPTSCGRFCHSCQKELFDFRQMSNDEILAIHQSTRGKVCGMYKEEQVEVVKTISPKRLSMQGWKAWYLGFLGILFVETADAQEVSDSTKVEQLETTKEGIQMGNKIYSYHGGVIRELKKPRVADTLLLSGVVMDSIGAPLVGVYIVFGDSGESTGTDIDGFFSFDLTPQLKDQDSIKIVLNYFEFEEKEVLIFKKDFPINGEKEIKIVMEEEGPWIIGETVVLGYRISLHRRVWYGIKRFFRFEWLKKD